MVPHNKVFVLALSVLQVVTKRPFVWEPTLTYIILMVQYVGFNVMEAGVLTL